VTFQGEPYGSGVSFFLADNEPGAGTPSRDLDRPVRNGALHSGVRDWPPLTLPW